MQTLVTADGSVVAVLSKGVEVYEDRIETPGCTYPLKSLGDGWKLVEAVEGEPPTVLHKWDGKQWVAPPASAADQEAAWQAIVAHRERLWDEGGYRVEIKDRAYWFHSDAKSCVRLLGLLKMGQDIPAEQPWKTKSGEFVNVTAEVIEAVFRAAALQENAVFLAAERHKAAMLASPDPRAYDFRGDWPETFGAK